MTRTFITLVLISLRFLVHFFLFWLGFLTAVLQTHARERNVPVDSLSFCYQVLNEKWTNDERVHTERNVDFKRIAFQVCTVLECEYVTRERGPRKCWWYCDEITPGIDFPSTRTHLIQGSLYQYQSHHIILIFPHSLKKLLILSPILLLHTTL